MAVLHPWVDELLPEAPALEVVALRPWQLLGLLFEVLDLVERSVSRFPFFEVQVFQPIHHLCPLPPF